ncbi:MAG: hypothetical protein A3J74_08165 [Elusimicrobia bacterium RIFCSPHIGHO2_02_FULL_57_9]|nr:MAG: hypothetical protein A3J74_08165 [Elusimicrobia bacterium RIFCSPHIGHO2_02_FULL_57_9]
MAQVRLKPRQEHRVLGGHLWIFSNEIARVEGSPEPGALARVLTASGRLLGTAFYNPKSLIACRMISFEDIVPDAGFFKLKLAQALAYRRRLFPGASSYRLCFGESDGLGGLVLDRYDSLLVMQIFSAGMERRIGLIQEALQELLSPRGIYLKNDHRSRGLEGLKAESRVLSGSVAESVRISENGLDFAVPIGGGQKTGFYFDQSENRVFLRPYFPGRVVLDLYCYNGAFALNAVKFGAKAALGVDSSASAIHAARENAALNGVEGAASFEEGDAEAALQTFARGFNPLKPDVIVLDPPSFSPSKKDLPKALRRYARLNALALEALPRGGMLATATCSHHVSREFFISMLRAASARARKPARLLALRGQAGDHPVLLAMPETEYLHFALLEIV